MDFDDISFEKKPWHQTVLLEETVSWVVPEGGKYFVDGTVGGGGHALHLLERYPDAQLLGLDRDLEALERAKENLKGVEDRVILHQGSYERLGEHLVEVGFPEQVDGIMLDLGVNSHQLDDGSRGFSFRHDGPLDMRFSPDDDSIATAAELVNTLSEKELSDIFFKWGEERQARRAAKAIIRYRQEQLFTRTSELRDCLGSVLKTKKFKKGIDPATRCFQALRIVVNDELGHLDRFLEKGSQFLNKGGRLAIISFHSLEDRRVKWQFREWAKDCVCPSDFPICVCDKQAEVKILTRRPISPSAREIENNARARSAHLRVFERL